MFLEKEDELSKFDYIFFFNANFKFYNPVDLAEITPCEWHDGLVAGLHPGRSGDINPNPDNFPYERRPKSKAYIPFGTGKHYVCGAFNGGTSKAFLKMCRKLKRNVQIDLDNNVVACVDDESHLNAYLVNKKFLLCGRAYGLPEGMIKRIPKRQQVMIKIISREKDSPQYGGTKYLRGSTDKKLQDNIFTPVLRISFRAIACLSPNRKIRKKIRSYFG
jgi:hypothetical protein